MEEIKRQGMSKGCLVGLIVAGAVLLIIIVVGLTCYFKRDDLMKFGVAQLMGSVKVEVASQHFMGVDSAKFDALVDSFVGDLNSSPLDLDKYQKFMNVLQHVSIDKKIDSSEVYILADAMVAYYSELASRWPGAKPDSILPVSDSMPPGEGTARK